MELQNASHMPVFGPFLANETIQNARILLWSQLACPKRVTPFPIITFPLLFQITLQIPSNF